MTSPSDNTALQQDIRGKSEEELLNPVGLDEYRKVMDFFHQSLYRLKTSLFIVDQIERFPFDLFTTIDDRVFLSHVITVFMDDALMTVYKLVVDNDYSYTIQQLKNKVIPQDRREVGFIKDEYKKSLSGRIEALYFDQKTRQVRELVNDLRNERVGHSARDWVLGNSTMSLPDLTRFRQLIKATQELFNALCFNTHRTLLPISYDPSVTHPKSGDNRPDIEKILDFFARESVILNMPEREVYPGMWERQKQELKLEQIEQINYYRKKFNLPEV